MIDVSILCPIHRYGGIDILSEGLVNQTFKNFELVLCDKLYDFRKEIIEVSFPELNIKHFRPKEYNKFNAHSAVLNDCLNMAEGNLCIVMGDYTYVPPNWIETHILMHKLNPNCIITGPQIIYGLPPLKQNLYHDYTTFDNHFNIEMFKTLPTFFLDPKLQMPYCYVDHNYCYNRNESFLRADALSIGGWDERYDTTTGFNNKEFYLRMMMECNLKIANVPQLAIHRIMSFPIPPHNKFFMPESDDSRDRQMYIELCERYGIKL